MQNTIHTLKFLSGEKYWRETLDGGNCLPLYFLVLLKYMLPVHVLIPVQCNCGFGGTEGLFCVQQTLECFWALNFLNMGRMMGMCRLIRPQNIIWIEPRGVWGRKKIIYIWGGFECETWF